MTELYLRKVRVNLIPETGQAVVIENLRTLFEIEKTNKQEPNKMKLRIHNMNETHRSAFEVESSVVAVEAGYGEDLETAFIGTISKTVHQKTSTEIITTVEAEDGGNRYRNAKIERAFPPGVKLNQIIKELRNQLGFSKATILGLPDYTYDNGVTLSGLVRDEMDNFTKSFDLEWSIQDQTLQIIPAGSPSTDEATYLSDETGLINSPEKTKEGVEFESLFQASLRPGRKVVIKSRVFDDQEEVFIVRRVMHTCDNRSGDFVSKCEATRG